MNFKKMMKRGQEGFTLVELIVVIAILGILAGIGIPAYSGYVEKAQKAVDDQSLAVVNNVLAVACISNEAALSEITGASLTISSNKVTAISVSGPANAANIQTDFMTYLGEVTFKTYTPSWDNTAKLFVGPDGAGSGSGTGTIPGVFADAAGNVSAEDKTAFNNSQFGTIGVDKVMNQVGTVTDLAAGLLADGNSESLQLMLGAGLGNLSSFLSEEELNKYPGETTEQKIAAYTDSLIKQKFEQMYPGVDYEAAKDENSEYYDEVQSVTGQVAANAAVLNAAKNTSSASYSNMQALLGDASKSPTSTLIASVKDDPSTGLAQVSAAYGLYYAYVSSQGGTVSNDPTEVLAGMDSDDFRNYVNNTDGKGQAEKDLAGYNGAMNMVNSSVTNKEQAEYVAMNGFDDPGLEALMKEILSN